jgi:hypothetical protein
MNVKFQNEPQAIIKMCKNIIEHIKPIMVRYFEDTFLKNASVNERDSNTYHEFKKLYQIIKK